MRNKRRRTEITIETHEVTVVRFSRKGGSTGNEGAPGETEDLTQDRSTEFFEDRKDPYRRSGRVPSGQDRIRRLKDR